jgi:hypothetical protein
LDRPRFLGPKIPDRQWRALLFVGTVVLVATFAAQWLLFKPMMGDEADFVPFLGSLCFFGAAVVYFWPQLLSAEFPPQRVFDALIVAGLACTLGALLGELPPYPFPQP